MPDELTPLTMTDAHAILESSCPERVARAAENAVRMEAVPGKRVSIWLDGEKEPILSVSMENDGTITVKSPRVGERRRYLPDPERMGDNDRICMGAGNLIRNAAGRAAAREAMAQAGIGPEPRQGKHLVAISIGGWARKQGRAMGKRLRATDICREAQDAVRVMINPATYRAARGGDARLIAERYNRAVLGGQALTEVERTNPAAAGWVLGVSKQAQRLGHAGEAVALTRMEMERQGIERQHWRTISRMSRATVEALAPRYLPQYIRAVLFNGSASARTDIKTSAAAEAAMIIGVTKSRAHHIRPPRTDEDPIYTMARETLTRAVRLLVTPQAGEEEEAGQPWAVGDYLADLIDRGEPLRAKTRSGLLKAARRYHGDRALRRQREEAERAADLAEGWIPQWNSLVGESSLETPNHAGITTIVPLTDESALLEEGRIMRHCVPGYTRVCQRGSSRIFSIRRDNKRLATAEISNRNGRWATVQVRGFRNGPVDDDVKSATQAIATAYQQQWARLATENQQERHRSWLYRPATGETKEQPATAN